MHQYQAIAALIVKKLREEITPAEDGRLMEWVNSSPANGSLYEQFMDTGQFEDLLKTTYQSRSRIEQKLMQVLETKKRRGHFLNWKRWLAAAVLVLAAGAGGYMIFNRTKPALPAKKALLTVPAPDRSRATITLGDGRTVYLDSAGVGQLTLQGNIKLVKLANGQLAYKSADGTLLTREVYNTLTNPKGSKVIDMQLSDGTHVWLNAGSSITYPVVFIGKERTVALKGEGYFEVAKDPARRFRVTSNGFSVEVLGTHFNVNTYDGEPASKITLLEGSVVVKPALEKAAGNEGVRLVPGQQAVLRRSNGDQINVGPADMDQVMAWKNGLFQFRSDDVASIARQLGTWYNVTIVYRGTEDKKVTGYISRTAPLSEVLKMLEIATDVHAENKNGMIVLQ